MVIDLETATTLDSIVLPGYDGEGTITLTRDQRWAFVASSQVSGQPTTVYVIQAPFGSTSQVHTLSVPSSMDEWQDLGIAVDGNGRVFVYHRLGISVIDPPYETISFEIPVPNNTSGAIAITEDGQTLLVTKMTSSASYVGILRAPFSPTTVEEQLPIPGPRRLDGVIIAPDGTFALASVRNAPEILRIAAPFASDSAVENIPVPVATVSFETITLDPSGRLGVLSGNSLPPNDPYVFVEAPFTAADATFHVVTPLGDIDRGPNPVRFMPALVFGDGFESGDTSFWDQQVP